VALSMLARTSFENPVESVATVNPHMPIESKATNKTTISIDEMAAKNRRSFFFKKKNTIFSTASKIIKTPNAINKLATSVGLNILNEY